jgi:hypothetical protein
MSAIDPGARFLARLEARRAGLTRGSGPARSGGVSGWHRSARSGRHDGVAARTAHRARRARTRGDRNRCPDWPAVRRHRGARTGRDRPAVRGAGAADGAVRRVRSRGRESSHGVRAGPARPAVRTPAPAALENCGSGFARDVGRTDCCGPLGWFSGDGRPPGPALLWRTEPLRRRRGPESRPVSRRGR